MQKMIKVNGVMKENMKENNPNWTQIPDQSDRILKIVGFELGKKILFNLINQEIDIGETYLYVKDPKESKY